MTYQEMTTLANHGITRVIIIINDCIGYGRNGQQLLYTGEKYNFRGINEFGDIEIFVDNHFGGQNIVAINQNDCYYQ